MKIVSFEKKGENVVINAKDTEHPEALFPEATVDDVEVPFDGDAIRFGSYLFKRESASLDKIVDGKTVPVAHVDDWPEEAMDLYFLFELQAIKPTYRDVAVALGLFEFHPEEFLDARK